MSQLPICTRCGLPKQPVGRDAPVSAASSLCNDQCPGYRDEPLPGVLWPGEMKPDGR